MIIQSSLTVSHGTLVCAWMFTKKPKSKDVY